MSWLGDTLNNAGKKLGTGFMNTGNAVEVMVTGESRSAKASIKYGEERAKEAHARAEFIAKTPADANEKYEQSKRFTDLLSDMGRALETSSVGRSLLQDTGTLQNALKELHEQGVDTSECMKAAADGNVKGFCEALGRLDLTHEQRGQLAKGMAGTLGTAYKNEAIGTIRTKNESQQAGFKNVETGVVVGGKLVAGAVAGPAGVAAVDTGLTAAEKNGAITGGKVGGTNGVIYNAGDAGYKLAKGDGAGAKKVAGSVTTGDVVGLVGDVLPVKGLGAPAVAGGVEVINNVVLGDNSNKPLVDAGHSPPAVPDPKQPDIQPAPIASKSVTTGGTEPVKVDTGTTTLKTGRTVPLKVDTSTTTVKTGKTEPLKVDTSTTTVITRQTEPAKPVKTVKAPVQEAARETGLESMISWLQSLVGGKASELSSNLVTSRSNPRSLTVTPEVAAQNRVMDKMAHMVGKDGAIDGKEAGAALRELAGQQRSQDPYTAKVNRFAATALEKGGPEVERALAIKINGRTVAEGLQGDPKSQAAAATILATALGHKDALPQVARNMGVIIEMPSLQLTDTAVAGTHRVNKELSHQKVVAHSGPVTAPEKQSVPQVIQKTATAIT